MTEVRAEIVLPTSDLRQDLAVLSPRFWYVDGHDLPGGQPGVVAVMSGHGLRVQLDAGSTAAPGHLRILTMTPAGKRTTCPVAPKLRLTS